MGIALVEVQVLSSALRLALLVQRRRFLFVILISYRIYHNSDLFQLKCIISDVDGEKYCVRDRSKLDLAADKLAGVNKNLRAIPVRHITAIKGCLHFYTKNPLKL